MDISEKDIDVEYMPGFNVDVEQDYQETTTKISKKVGDKVFLKTILNSTKTLARGRVQSLDPNDLVGGTEIGPEWCEVNVQVPIKKMKTW
ncbi:putative transposase, Tnp1/En/Spm [Helianthus annuus]|uniref:Transposase, Tnp1/En/Spm n=1 Tax=Helianthus annuus TaxID=4232 RepID=A0A9K3EF12_HELAN|nr:putative transposase, Tnp1/En/Spm [Helianthus annuus]KAJ0476275.1 putative transposase, Tnp1/En/Spm [Helianthus annuus]KAJ0480393.1 putative transposase, Tnp1/En/Spm [Helianthus annuus]KAJ0497082.1 putative transposase, Tnp1/En/Spm [Helianthus annuus]KAJ0848485.1 putative transposase, Tnp1/En/Spm [Helianthus annuus]